MVAKTVIANYRIWSKHSPDAEDHSSVLFDTVAVYLAMHRNLCKMERLRLRVDDGGFTVPDPKGREMDVATSWKDLNGYREFLEARLVSETSIKLSGVSGK